jgi:hypothetical protein
MTVDWSGGGEKATIVDEGGIKVVFLFLAGDKRF